MANVSIREAVKIYNVSRPTLTKALKSGKISGVQDGKGQWQIDPAELSRVYHPREDKAVKGGQKISDNFPTINTYEIEQLKGALAVAEARADVAEQLAQERLERIEDLRRMLPPPKEERPTQGFWSRFVGKGRDAK